MAAVIRKQLRYSTYAIAYEANSIKCDVGAPAWALIDWTWNRCVNQLRDSQLRDSQLEPSTSFPRHCDILVARVVCKVEQGLLPVPVINVNNESRTLKRGMKVGTLFTDIEVRDEVKQCEDGDSGDLHQSRSN